MSEWMQDEYVSTCCMNSVSNLILSKFKLLCVMFTHMKGWLHCMDSTFGQDISIYFRNLPISYKYVDIW